MGFHGLSSKSNAESLIAVEKLLQRPHELPVVADCVCVCDNLFSHVLQTHHPFLVSRTSVFSCIRGIMNLWFQVVTLLGCLSCLL